MRAAKTFDGLEALVQSLATVDMKDGLTIWEFAVKSGRNVKWIREKLNMLNAAGQLEIGKKQVRNLEGNMVMETAYKIIIPKVER